MSRPYVQFFIPARGKIWYNERAGRVPPGPAVGRGLNFS